MAKVTGPIDRKLWPTAMQKSAYLMTTQAGSFIRLQAIAARQTPEYLAQFTPKFAEAATAWNSLRAWKRARWTECALTRNMNGFQLYSGEYIRQKVPTPQIELMPVRQPGGTFIMVMQIRQRQPINPCSRRATDPNASPWDYVP